MKKSNWLERYEKEVKEMQEKSKSSKKAGLIVIPIMFLIILVLAMVNGGNSEVDITPYLIGLAVIVIFIFVMAAALSKRSVTKDAAKGARENLEELLVTPEQVDEFDMEMSAAPLCKFEVENGTDILFTEHYMVSRFNNMGLPDYRFARLSDIVKNDFAVSRDESKVHGMGKLYAIDLLDSNGRKLIGTCVPGKKKMAEFEQLLTKYCPGIQLKEHKLLQ